MPEPAETNGANTAELTETTVQPVVPETLFPHPAEGLDCASSQKNATCPTDTLNSAQLTVYLLGMSSWPCFRTLGLGMGNEYSC